MKNNYCVIIPARYESSRLPGKPLIDLNGLPMIVRTFYQCLEVCKRDLIYVATDDLRIKEVCEQYKIQVLLTSDAHLTGTDRLSECSELLDYDTFINVQGDEPVFNPLDLKKIIDLLDKHPNEILNGYCRINNEEQFRSFSVPKVVFCPNKKLLYMSRSPIPIGKEGFFDIAWRQVCIYSFPRNALKVFSQHGSKTPLENIEDIELLRFIELGLEVQMIKMSEDSIPIDNPEDIKIVEYAIKERGL